MRKLLLSLTLLAMVNGHLAAQEAEPVQFAKPLAQLELQDGDSIVFLGDSITHQRLYTQYVEDYFYTRFPEMRLKIHNSGVGGARAWDALQRFDDDVAAYKPKYVTVLLGMNDGTYVPYHDETFQTYRQDMINVVDRIQDIGATPILMAPTMFDARAARLNPRRKRDPNSTALYNSVLAYYGTWCQEIATERGLGFVDMWSPLNQITFNRRKTDPNFTLIADAVHPGAAGQVVMATAMIDNLGLPRRVSNIKISKAANGDWAAKVTGGEISEIKETEDGISFQWEADSLPWVLPEEAAQGVRLTRLGHRLSGEMLEVHGLKPGKYDLLIDGQKVGTYDWTALGRHIELQGNAKTPQYQQALAVAMKNKERNETVIGELRKEWLGFQRYARTRRSAEAAPDNEQLQKQLKVQEAGVEGIVERSAKLTADATALEDEIFEMNTPPKREYVLKLAN
ncbi:SGNH/GDSL hydrolase family protein [Thalassoglobus polymorphus]|uniref:GDSL-like Lipase/Acylhydrolase n=1 Tax=Thalassoglobus polymorphus TaxID=2527994 RepID=A0A517QJJ8_9PLAN|nr:SGNH/GDSL hydrolase family protein [Thalassoglobus polymorphus]QDT31765.1 GDSL-like Lipase/Acylhydrolase [Thalassoglobus polymorphus]